MTVVESNIKPKEVTHDHEGQKFTCRYDKHAPTDKCWMWTVDFTRTYTYYGHSPTLSIALRAAKRKIHQLNNLAEKDDEELGG